ncbi:iron-sulfur cluster biosynthesis family protein [Gracilibacillus sp. D59]|uniref:iron-sulfur cluster biosynthesis family protein n=1 Tax=Gracilibacillus sp. D59 TaxID=3457434 RepID=UPI003FCCF0DF
MQLTITNNALDQLKSLTKNKSTTLALTYDTEGCGCGVNGMPTIALIGQKEKNHKKVECDQHDVVVHVQEATFFSEEMTLDYNGTTFRLTSPNEMLNPFIHVNSVIAQ